MVRAGPGEGQQRTAFGGWRHGRPPEIEGVNGGADLAEGLGLLLRIDVQQVVY